MKTTNFVKNEPGQYCVEPPPFTSFTTRSDLECAVLCAKDQECRSYSYSTTDRTCKLHDVTGFRKTASYV